MGPSVIIPCRKECHSCLLITGGEPNYYLVIHNEGETYPAVYGVPYVDHYAAATANNISRLSVNIDVPLALSKGQQQKALRRNA